MSPYTSAILTCLLMFSRDASSAKLEDPYGVIPCINCKLIQLDRDVQYHLHTRKNPDKPYILQLKNETNLAESPLNIEMQTVFFIHGFSETGQTISSQTISNAYLERDDYNVIRVDWANLAAAPSYIAAARNVKVVGVYLAQMIQWLEQQKAISVPNIHVIGFSLGAHVAGFMAKKLAPQMVGRITGLDPAGPMFEHGPASERLSKSDATFVDIVHTNSRVMGMEEPIGHVDFYPNRGESQPGCNFPDYACSHRRSWAYYAESVMNKRGFPASKCQTKMPIADCSKNPDAFMGFATVSQNRGVYLLKTNSQSPYSRNMTDYTKF